MPQFGMKPLFATKPASKPKVSYSIPVYHDSIGVVTRDGVWAGTRNCMVRKSALSQAFPSHFYTKKVDNIQWLLDVVLVGSTPWAWEARQHTFPFWFSLDSTKMYRPVKAYCHGTHVVLVDAAFGPPPAILYGREGISDYPLPLIDAQYESKVNLVLAPMSLDNEENLRLVAQLIAANMDDDALVFACMDVLSDPATPVSKDEILETLSSVTPKLLQKQQRTFLKTKSFVREALDDGAREVKSYLTSQRT